MLAQQLYKQLEMLELEMLVWTRKVLHSQINGCHGGTAAIIKQCQGM